MNDLDLRLEVNHCITFAVKYLGNRWLGSKGPPIENGIWGITRDPPFYSKKNTFHSIGLNLRSPAGTTAGKILSGVWPPHDWYSCFFLVFVVAYSLPQHSEQYFYLAATR